MKSKSVLSLAFASTILCSLSGAHGATIESFESGTLDGWNAGSLNSTIGAVDSVRASDGTHSYGNTFTVPWSFNGYTVANIIDKDPRAFLDPNTTTFSVDVYSNWTNPQSWGVYDNSIKLVLNYEGGYEVLDSTSGTLSNGSFETITFDLSAYSAIISGPAASGLSYDQIQIAWRLGTYSDGGNPGLDNGTQTFAVDNIQATVPEPSIAALGALAAFALQRRRRL